MAATRRRFDQDFKERAVRLVRESGEPIAQVARDLGVNKGTLGNWLKADLRRRAEGDGVLGENERTEQSEVKVEIVDSYESNDNDRLMALGLLTVRSAKLEEDLRRAFCDLVGSKYAPVVAGGQAASWLISQCEALVKANLEMSDDHKSAMKAALEECRKATEQRNILVHGVKITGKPGAPFHTVRSRRGTFEPIGNNWTDESIRAVNSKLSVARAALRDALLDALSRETQMLKYKLIEETHARRHP